MSSRTPELHHISRVEQDSSSKRRETYGWQVRFESKVHTERKFFRDSKFRSKENALIEAIKFRDKVIFAHPELLQRYSIHKLRTTLPSNNTSGILGVNRTEHLERNANVSEMWQTTFPDNNGKPKTRKFSVRKEGEIRALYLAIEARLEGISELTNSKLYKHSINEINFLIDRYLAILIFLDQLDDSQASQLLKTINNKNIPNTKKEDIILGRVGQQKFHTKVFKIYDGKCVITGSNLMLTAGHIKPWRVSDDRERLDPYNGLLFSPVYDKAFDLGYISFTDEGKILISDEFKEEAKKLRILENDHIENINALSLKYLKYHRENIFKNK